MRPASILLAIALSAAAPAGGADRAAFNRALPREAVELLAAGYRGRVAILDTVAREQLSHMCGDACPASARTPPAVTYLDVFFRTGAHLKRPLIRIRSASLRRRIAAGLDGAARDEFARTRRLPPLALLAAKAQRLARDADGAPRPQVASAAIRPYGRSYERALPEARELLAAGRAAAEDFALTPRIEAYADAVAQLEVTDADMIPLRRIEARYQSFLAIDQFRPVPAGDGDWHDAHAALKPTDAGDAALTWRVLRDAWRVGDAAAARRCLDDLAAAQRAAGAPAAARRRVERAYNRLWRPGVACLAFAAAFVAALVAVISRRRWPRRLAMALLGAATLLTGAAFAVRWALSDRPAYLPPVTNQFEGILASAMLAGAFALAAEALAARRGARGGVFALAGALYAAVALLGAAVLLGPVATGIGQPAGILHTPLLTAHVSVIIAAHALVGMTGAISLTYLAAHGWAVLRGRAGDTIRDALPDPATAIDRCNLLTAQLATCTLLVGIVLGAWWADTAWSRFWGWDAKETWSLITLVVYVIVLHARALVPAHRRGLVTAAGCLLGVGVMLFNWIVVNYLMTGKHSYV
ncbi:MAG: cytochrome c biogenesis protein CcsA [Phycisphaerae bacterium]|nr:cytochrome c biogenesis protein CcsA [Phycisphaerae bacterium]